MAETRIVTIEKLYGGFVDDFNLPARALEGREDQYSPISNTINIFRPGFKGYISPAEVFDQTFTDGSTHVTSYARAWISDVGQASVKSYMILGGLAGTAPRITETDTD